MVNHKASNSINRKSSSSTNPHRPVTKKGATHMRSKATINRLNMYNNGAAIRDKKGKIIGGSLLMRDQAGGADITSSTGRIAPDRRWFGNTRTISQKELDDFRDVMNVKEADPYSVLLRRKKIPMALLQESEKVKSMNILETESFDSVFGSKSTRNRPKMNTNLNDMNLSNEYDALLANAQERGKEYDADPLKDTNISDEEDGASLIKKEDLFMKGQSKRIWAELYKVLDSSDVILQIVDARNVPGTRSKHIENHIKKNASHKHLVIVINKCDLVPSWVTRKWVKKISEEIPCLAFHASMTNCFGKGALINLLRQFSKLHSDKRNISVGIIGYPNTGKSSVINALMGSKCCKAAPVPGETKVWQYITLMKRIYLIDCPGVVYDTGDNEAEIVLKGVVRAEKLSDPSDFIEPILDRVKKEYIEKQYMVSGWTDHIDFLTKLGMRNGKLKKGGDVDLSIVAVGVINDFQRGKLPYFVAPARDVNLSNNNGNEVNEDDEENDEGDLDEYAGLKSVLPEGEREGDTEG